MATVVNVGIWFVRNLDLEIFDVALTVPVSRRTRGCSESGPRKDRAQEILSWLRLEFIRSDLLNTLL